MKDFYLILPTPGQTAICPPLDNHAFQLANSLYQKICFLSLFIENIHHELQTIIKVFAFLPDAASEENGGHPSYMTGRCNTHVGL